jgi:hypothetical protein
MEIMSGNDIVGTKVLPVFRPIVEEIRVLKKSCAPDAKEIISYGIPAYKVKTIIAVISPTKKDIALAFSRGAEFEEKYHLLQGVGKVSKNLKFVNLSDIDEDILCYYIQQALELDAKLTYADIRRLMGIT